MSRLLEFLVEYDKADREHRPQKRDAWAGSFVSELRDIFDDARLEEIARAEAEGRCVVLPFAVGDMVKPKGTGENVKPIRVDAVTIYKDARPTISFHEQGMKMTYVDEWSEDAPTEYDKVAALDKRGEDA